MKRQIIFILIVLFIFSNSVVNAQRNSDSHQDRWEKYRTEKISFITKNLDFTPAEAEKFWPVYNQMEKEKREAQKKRSELEDKVRDAEEALSEKEVVKLTREFASSMQKEGSLFVQYNEKFLEFLPPHKVLKLYKTEKEFRMYMFKMYRDRSKEDKK